MNTTRKGNRIKWKAKILMEQDDWIVGNVESSSKYAKTKDLFGLFDLFCLKEQTVRFVQVTCGVPHSHKKYLEFAKRHGSINLWIDQLCWKDYFGFTLYSYYPIGDNAGSYKTKKRLY